MFGVEGLGGRTKDLERQRDRLVDDLKKLEEKHEKGEIDEDEYKEKRHEIERAIVEVMDRLAQMKFLSGQA
ncbi:MAG: hypothetical protein GTO24_18805 [candidate division Zixibacteria bacterium]|nr:hypothetical protein [candidate division Zixibacteria bacterium]